MSEIQFEDFERKYRFERQLSHGSFGHVCRIRQINTPNVFALKKLVVKNIQEVEEALAEIQFTMHLTHPSIITIYQHYNIQIIRGYGRPQREIGIIMECAQASLNQFIASKQCLGTWNFLLTQVSSIIEVLALLQKQNIAHRDIKPGNILLFPNSQSEYTWKLADFGLAVDLAKAKPSNKFVGSYDYASPSLRKKFKFQNLKIQTNTFKDDVYSLGITLLEVLTGSRKNNIESRFVLHETCSNCTLVKLVEIMLEEEQQKRPCFKELLFILQEEGIGQKEDRTMVGNTKVKPSMRVSVSNTKTIPRKQILQPSVHFSRVKKGVLCLAGIDGAILCGCNDGSVILLNEGNEILVGKMHDKFVSNLKTDVDGNIWSCGGDGRLLIWNRKYLLKAIKNSQYIVHEEKIKNIFKREVDWKIKREKRLMIEQNMFEEIILPFNHQGGISILHCIDRERFVVGFCDGFVFCSWKGEEFHAKLHTLPVTTFNINFQKKRIYSGGYDGAVKSIILDDGVELDAKFFSDGTRPIVGLQSVYGGLIGVLSLDGNVTCIDADLRKISENKLPIDNVMGTSGQDDSIYLVTNTGDILDANEEMISRLGERGWSSVSKIGVKELALGNLSGKVARVRW